MAKKCGKITIKVGRFKLDTYYGEDRQTCKTYRDALTWAKEFVASHKLNFPFPRAEVLHFPPGSKRGAVGETINLDEVTP